jgi:hypothetical protein
LARLLEDSARLQRAREGLAAARAGGARGAADDLGGRDTSTAQARYVAAEAACVEVAEQLEASPHERRALEAQMTMRVGRLCEALPSAALQTRAAHAAKIQAGVSRCNRQRCTSRVPRRRRAWRWRCGAKWRGSRRRRRRRSATRASSWRRRPRCGPDGRGGAHREPGVRGQGGADAQGVGAQDATVETSLSAASTAAAAALADLQVALSRTESELQTARRQLEGARSPTSQREKEARQLQGDVARLRDQVASPAEFSRRHADAQSRAQASTETLKKSAAAGEERGAA